MMCFDPNGSIFWQTLRFKNITMEKGFVLKDLSLPISTEDVW